jgi:hypothetical protein
MSERGKASAEDGPPREERERRPDAPQPNRGPVQPPGEVNGPPGPEPTRFGDWEKGGRCSDF